MAPAIAPAIHPFDCEEPEGFEIEVGVSVEAGVDEIGDFEMEVAVAVEAGEDEIGGFEVEVAVSVEEGEEVIGGLVMEAEDAGSGGKKTIKVEEEVELEIELAELVDVLISRYIEWRAKLVDPQPTIAQLAVATGYLSKTVIVAQFGKSEGLRQYTRQCQHAG